MSLKSWFNGIRVTWKRNSEIASAVEEAYHGIAASDAVAVEAALSQVRREEADPDARGGLLKAAVGRGDGKVFVAVLAFTGDPNETVPVEYSGLNGTVYTVRYPLLEYALNVRSHDIALDLAKDPRTDIEKCARNKRGSYIDGAKGAGMRDVAAVLIRRTAELRRQEAEQWEQEAAQLGIDSQPH